MSNIKKLEKNVIEPLMDFKDSRYLADLSNCFQKSDITLDWIKNYLFNIIDRNYQINNYHCFRLILEITNSSVIDEDFIENDLFKRMDRWFRDEYRRTVNDYLFIYNDFSESFLERNMDRFVNDYNIVCLFNEQNFSESFFIKYVDLYLEYIKDSCQGMVNAFYAIEINRRLPEELKRKFINFLKVRLA